MTGSEVVSLLKCFRFHHTAEEDLQRAIAQVLKRRNVPFRREVKIGPRDRIDFLIDGGVGIEVKVHGTASAAARQLQRYAKSDDISELVLVTSRSQAGAQLEEYLGKPVLVHVLFGGLG